MDKNNGIMIFKDIFEYYKDGDLNEEGFCELMMLIYETKWGTEPDINNIQNRMCKTIWKGLRHSIKKSVRNAKYQNNKSTLQEVKSTEFDTPKQEIENKPILSPSKPLVDNLYHPEDESASNGLKVGKNEALDNEPKVLPNVKLVATAQTPSIPTFEEVLKDEKDTIEDIINDFNAGGMKSRLQAPTRLNELLNRKWGRYYKEQITEYINNRRVA